MGFPAAVAGIIIVGLVLVFLARDARINGDGSKPRANQDKWYEAYGLYDCDEYLANPPAPKNESDIMTQGNGLISVFPLSDKTAGDNATLGKFFDAMDMKVTDTSVKMADGTTYKAGDACGAGKHKTTKTEIKLFIWPPQASNKTKPEVITSDFGSVRIEQDKGAYALALVPASTKTIDLPGSIGNLDDPEGSVPATTAVPTTTTPGATTTAPAATTTAPAATTTAPGATTTAPAATTTTKG
ncbi:MAG: hypothetical protein U0Q22_05325 [Acidimicrobiales bacterium]